MVWSHSHSNVPTETHTSQWMKHCTAHIETWGHKTTSMITTEMNGCTRIESAIFQSKSDYFFVTQESQEYSVQEENQASPHQTKLWWEVQWEKGMYSESRDSVSSVSRQTRDDSLHSERLLEATAHSMTDGGCL